MSFSGEDESAKYKGRGNASISISIPRLSKIFQKRVIVLHSQSLTWMKLDCQGINIWFKIMLIISNTPSDPTHVYSSHRNVKVMLSLSHITSFLQPLGQGVMANFKASYIRRTFRVWISVDSFVYTYQLTTCTLCTCTQFDSCQVFQNVTMAYVRDCLQSVN